jgi:hypothetical protein
MTLEGSRVFSGYGRLISFMLKRRDWRTAMKIIMVMSVVAMLWGAGQHDFATRSAETISRQMEQTVHDPFTRTQADILSGAINAVAGITDQVMSAIAMVAVQEQTQGPEGGDVVANRQ